MIFQKRWFVIAFFMIISSLLSCGGGGGGNSEVVYSTTISTPSQAGQAVALSMGSIENLASAYTVLSGLIEDAGGSGSAGFTQITQITKDRKVAPDIKRLSGLLKGTSWFFKTNKFKTQNLSSIIQVQTTRNCGISGTFIYDDLGDDNPITYRLTYYNCRETYDASTGIELNGVVELSCSDSICTTVTLALGSSSPYRESYFSDNTFTLKTDEFRAEFSLKLQNTRLVGNGYIEYYYYFYYQDGSYDLEKERLLMNSFEMKNLTTTSDGSTTSSITANGTLGYSYSLNGDLILSISTLFDDFNYILTDVMNSYMLLSVNGRFSVDLYPDNACFEGIFNVVTDVPVRYDYSLMRTTDGRLSFNDNTIVIYNPDGSITITVNGLSETFEDEYELYGTCPLI